MKRYLIFGLIALSILIQASMAAQINVGDGSFAVADGDMLELTGFANGSSMAWMWMFTFQQDTSIIGAPIEVTGGTFKTNVKNVTKLPVGKYMMVVELGGVNDIQEVLYAYNNNTHSYEFTSPWRAPKTVKSDENPYARIRQIETYCNNNKQYCDDTFYTTNVTVEKPFIKFTDMYQYQYSDLYQGKSDIRDITKSGLLYLAGSTNMDPKTQITITLDNNQTVKAVTEQVDPNGYYKWSAFLDISKLRTGSRHPILITSPRTDDLQTFLEIGLSPITPKPTPTPMKVVSNEFQSSAGSTISGPSTEITTKVTVAPNQFVSVVTPETVPAPTVIPNNAPISNPDIGDKVIASPTKSNKLPIDASIVISGLIISVIIFSRIKKLK